MSRADAFDRLSSSPGLVQDFNSLTATGGRLVGSASEAAARDWLQGRLQRIPDVRLSDYRFHYSSWASRSSGLELFAPGGHQQLACHPLYWSPDTPADGLEASIIVLDAARRVTFVHR